MLTSLTPICSATSAGMNGSWAMIVNPNGLARSATIRAIVPNPSSPSVIVERRRIGCASRRACAPRAHSPERTRMSIVRSRRITPRISAIAWSATSITNVSGTFATSIPYSLAASTSMSSYPTYGRKMKRTRRIASKASPLPPGPCSTTMSASATSSGTLPSAPRIEEMIGSTPPSFSALSVVGSMLPPARVQNTTLPGLFQLLGFQRSITGIAVMLLFFVARSLRAVLRRR
jgi:hypothetical protein